MGKERRNKNGRNREFTDGVDKVVRRHPDRQSERVSWNRLCSQVVHGTINPEELEAKEEEDEEDSR